MYSSEYDNMGGAMAMIIIAIVFVIGALSHSRKKQEAETQQAFQMQQQEQAAMEYQRQEQIKHQRFRNEFGDNPFDSDDIFLAEKVMQYAGDGNQNYEKVKGVASLLGGLKKNVAETAGRAAAQEIKRQLESNRHNIETAPPVRIPQRPIIIEHPVYHEPEPPRRIRFYDDGNDQYYYQNARRKNFNHYT